MVRFRFLVAAAALTVLAMLPAEVASASQNCTETGFWGGLEDIVPNTGYHAAKGTRGLIANTDQDFDGCFGPNAITQFMNLKAQTFGMDYIETGIYESENGVPIEKLFVEYRVWPAPIVFQFKNNVPAGTEWFRLKLESPANSTDWQPSVSWGDTPINWNPIGDPISGLYAGSGWPIVESAIYSYTGNADAYMYQRNLWMKNGHGTWLLWWDAFCYQDSLLNWEPAWLFTATRAEAVIDSGPGVCTDTPPTIQFPD